MKKLFVILTSIFLSGSILAGNQWSVNSPDNKTSIQIKSTDKIYYSVNYKDHNILWYSPISMTLANGEILGLNSTFDRLEQRTSNNIIKPVWGTRSEITDHYNEIELFFDQDFSLIFRAYNDGIAYRFKTSKKGDITIKSEEVQYRFLDDHKLIAHVVDGFVNSYEKNYTKYQISEVKENSLTSLPLVVDQTDIKIAITESDLFDYPGMYLTKKGSHDRYYLDATFPNHVVKDEIGGWGMFNKMVKERADYLAVTEGKRAFPWRVLIIAEEDAGLADNDLVYKLARPSKISTDWIKPGKVAWDWWNAWNLSGVDFETGINNKTYEYYIDFASKNNIEYIIMDEGWSDQFDMMLPTPWVDIPHLVKYANEKDVKIILWGVWHTIDRQMDEALNLFEKWGVAGLKIDFIDRDDQYAINFYERLAKKAAEHKLLIDYHGCSKPTGLHRTYPNVINYEAVRGNEYNKFAEDETPEHNIDIVFTRMLAGPIDYTPGAMKNSIKGDFSISNINPMSYGTRCHQLGMYVVYYAPLQMLCDAPTSYEKYPDILKFLGEVPVSWDQTKVLKASLGEYIVIARKKGNDWYIGALNDWNERSIEIDLSFLNEGTYLAEMYIDGLNANKTAEDYIFDTKEVNQGSNIKLNLKKGGGAAIKISKL